MKKALLLLLLFITSIYSQTTDFSVIIKRPFNAALFDVTQDYDRSITAVGFSKDFKQDSNDNRTYSDAFEYLANTSAHSGTQMHLIKVNNSAKVILSNSSKLSRFSEAIAVVKTPSNGYFVGGYTMDGSLLVLNLNASGEINFIKTFGTKNYDRMNNLVLLSDGGVLAVGSSVTSRSLHDNKFETGLGENDIYLTRFSKNGKKLWSKKYGTTHDDSGIDAVEARDGSIVVISTTSYDKHKDVTLMRITENGNKMWLKHYEGEKLVTPHKIIRLRDNNFLVSLSQYDNMQKEQIRLIKFDLYKNVHEDKTIFTTYPSVLHDIQEFSDGTLMGVGYVKDTYNTDGLVMLFNSHLSMLNQEHYGGENYDVFNALSILNNSQVAVVGLHTDDASQESNMWLVKLNKDASMAQIKSTKSFYDILHDIYHVEIANKQIAIHEDLSIEFLDKNLYFQVGIYTLTKKQKMFLNSFAKKLIPFLQNNQEFIENLEINGHTSSEWSNVDFSSNYLHNEKLSLERSFSVLSYMFQTQNRKTQNLLAKKFKGSGLNYSQRVVMNNSEDRVKSRRVSFKILLK